MRLSSAAVCRGASNIGGDGGPEEKITAKHRNLPGYPGTGSGPVLGYMDIIPGFPPHVGYIYRSSNGAITKFGDTYCSCGFYRHSLLFLLLPVSLMVVQQQ